MTEHRTAELQFYLTTDSPCPYLPNRTERKVFTHLGGRRAGEMHDLLSLHGFRRSKILFTNPLAKAVPRAKVRAWWWTSSRPMLVNDESCAKTQTW